jgi:hypothetical protein
MVEMMNAYKILVGQPEGKSLLGDLDLRTILKGMLKKYLVCKVWTGFMRLRIRSSGGLTFGLHKSWVFSRLVELLFILMKDPDPWN